MKPIVLILFIISISANNSFSQHVSKSHDQHKQFDVESFKKKKADYIISEANLTSSEAAAFIPLMNELFHKRFELNRRLRIESRDLKMKQNKTSADYDDYLKLMIESEIQEAELNRAYFEKFKKILSSEKICKYREAENHFMKQTIKGSKMKQK